VTLLLFPCVMEEAGRTYVRDMPWPLHGRMQYDYKQTNITPVKLILLKTIQQVTSTRMAFAYTRTRSSRSSLHFYY